MFPFLHLFKDVTEGFVGCLNNLRLREKMIGRWKQNKDVIPCSEMVEPGYFFGPGGGSIMVSNQYISFYFHKIHKKCVYFHIIICVLHVHYLYKTGVQAVPSWTRL